MISTVPVDQRSGRRLADFGLLLLAAFLWSTNYLLALPLLDWLAPVQLTFLRWTIGAPLLLIVAVAIERPNWRLVFQDGWRHVLAALAGVVAYNVLNYAALAFTGPAEAAIVNSVNPVAIALLARLVLGTPLRRVQIVGLVLSLVGVGIVVSRGALASLAATSFNVGELLVLLAVVCWAVYTVVGRTMRTPPITSVAVQAVMAVVVLSPVALASPVRSAGFVPLDVVWLGLLVTAPTCVAFVLWNVGVRRVGPSTAGIFINTMPVFTSALAALVGVQRFTTDLLIGGAVVLAGLLVSTAQFRGRRRV